MRIICDFKCANEHIHESWVDSEVRTEQCPECELIATRIISGTSFVLEGTSGDFPGAAMKWDRRHGVK